MEQLLELAKRLQDFRSQLEIWGITNEALIAVGLLAFCFFLLSVREVAGWFLKTGGLRREIRDLKSQVARLEEAISRLHEVRETPTDVPNQNKNISATGSESEGPAPRAFRLDH